MLISGLQPVRKYIESLGINARFFTEDIDDTKIGRIGSSSASVIIDTPLLILVLRILAAKVKTLNTPRMFCLHLRSHLM